MGIKYVFFDGNSIRYTVTESGKYSPALMDKNGEILFVDADVHLNKDLEYTLGIPGDGLKDGFELNIGSFGRLGKNHIDEKLKFIHIPKNAGTSIEDFGFLLGAKWGRVDRKYIFSINPAYWWHSSLKQTGDIYPEHDKFCVVRNPYKRLISIVYCNLRAYIPSTVEEFNLDISRSIQEIISNPFNNAFSHWIPQSDFVYLNDERIVNHVLKFENLDLDLHDLLSSYGVENRMTIHSNKSNKEKRFGISDLYPETLRLFNETYSKDFEYFGYETISPSDI